MKEVKCEVIRDLLPLYEDNAASEETQELVRAHLKDCPGCREELRKMRVPISMPPDEDEEAVKRFLEHRAEVRRKQNVKIVRVASVLAALIVFCLCYTLIPRSWDSVSRGIQPDRIMGSYTVFAFYDDHPNIDVLTIDAEHGDDAEMIDAIMDALRAGSFRAELRNVVNYTFLAPLLRDTGVKGSDGVVSFTFVKDNDLVADIFFYKTRDHKVHIRMHGDFNWYFYHDCSGKLYEAAAALVKEYSAPQEK